MENEIVKLIAENVNLLDKALMLIGLWLFHNYSKRLDRLFEAVGNVDKHVAIMITKNDAYEKDIDKNKKDILMLRERYHDLVNDNIGKISMNELKIEALEQKINTM